MIGTARQESFSHTRADQQDQEKRILALTEQHRRSDHRCLGIICKTLAQAKALYDTLAMAGVELSFLDHDSTSFAGGIVITSAHIAKGLEFDVGIVPQVDDSNHATEMDRSMLYVACTRATHELHLTHDGRLSRFLQFAQEPAAEMRASA